MQIKMSRDEKVKLMAQGLYHPKSKYKTTHFVTRRPTDPVYAKEKQVIGMGQAFVIKYECECGTRVPESTKKCPQCGRLNPDVFESEWRKHDRRKDKEE